MTIIKVLNRYPSSILSSVYYNTHSPVLRWILIRLFPKPFFLSHQRKNQRGWCFSWYSACGVASWRLFCCLWFSLFSLRRFRAFFARFGGVRRFSAGCRLLPLRLSLCFLLRRVGFIIVWGYSSPFYGVPIRR